jgi:p-hydroxybenzoate 3-monooxygenase
LSRFYLQVAPGTQPDDWTDERIWASLRERLAAGGLEPARGRIVERSTLQLHSHVTEPMQQGNVFLAGDAAHIVTPAGGKGMNLALQDADELAAGLLEHYGRGDRRRLLQYSATRLPAVVAGGRVLTLDARPPAGASGRRTLPGRLARCAAGAADGGR